MIHDSLPKPPQTPPLFTGTPTSIINDANRLIEHYRKVQNQVAQSVTLDAAVFANVVLPLAHAENALHFESNILCFYKEVSPDDAIRNASSQSQTLLNNFAIETSMREDLYHLVDAVVKKNESLDPESSHLLEKMHKEYIRNGLALPAGSKRNRFKEIRKRLAQLSVDFRKNQSEDVSGIWFYPKELDGVPEWVVSDLEKGSGENEGKLRLTLEYSRLGAAQQSATNSETRRRCQIGHENKCPDNVVLFKETVVLRDEAARLLGYPNHAAYRIEAKMAKTPKTVNAFLADLQTRLTPGGRKELEKLKELKKADLESRGIVFDGRFFLWDYGFYRQVMLKQEYNVDQQLISEYFSLETTVQGMLKIFQQLFGLVFQEIRGDKQDNLTEFGNGNKLVWHEDVQVFSVWDSVQQGNLFLGYLYLDLWARKHKYSGPSNWNLQPGFAREDGTRQYPATALLCSFGKPTATKPSLLRHDEVSTLFHELGHGIHDLVSKTRYSRFHGTNTVIDFGEAPSQMLENWCWAPSVLKSLSRHYSFLSPEYLESWKAQSNADPQPPERIPDEIIESLVGAKHANGALFQLRVLHYSMLDMMIHEPASHEAIESLNISVLYNKLRKELMQLDGPEVDGKGFEWGHAESTFFHVMADYDAGYYGYLYSQVLADDMFHTAFKADPTNAEEAQRYRYMVLEKGGSQNEMKTVTDFLGREPSTEAFYQELGVA
ncbi:metallopeptidase MepB [Bisporella sp. PMI_857]|nr:metallopeptidase MepB [Bisporella sp. PMI_857]